MDDLIVHDATITLFIEPLPAGEEDKWNLSNSYTILTDVFSMNVVKLHVRKLVNRAFNDGIKHIQRIKIQWSCPEYNPLNMLTCEEVEQWLKKHSLKVYKMEANVRPFAPIDYISIDIKVA